MSKYLVVTEGATPATALPVLATADLRLIRVALAAVLESLAGAEPEGRAAQTAASGSAVQRLVGDHQ